MAQYRSTFSVGMMSRVLEVSRSGFYDWCNRKISKRAVQNLFYAEKLSEIFETNEKVYGSPRLHKAMRKMGFCLGRERIARIMKLTGIRPITAKKFRVKTTDSEHSMPLSENLICRNFRTERPNHVWVSDITYVRIKDGFCYLCVIVDLFSRRIVGWSLKSHMRTSLIEDALCSALSHRKIEQGKLIHHSDCGSQYASRSFRKMLNENGILSSMSSKGDCYDNAVAESVFGTIKRERIHHRVYENCIDARTDLFQYIEGFYNRRRLHSYLDYTSPVEFELNMGAA